jgi:hypothetical protein
MDASAWWQDGAHNKGKTSDKAFKSRGWTHLYRPQKDSNRNPDIVERVKCTNARLKNKAGQRRMFSCACNVAFNKAMRSWENRNGVPYRRSEFAHLCDAGTYPIYRFFGVPKVSRKAKPQYRGLGAYDRAEMFPRA